MKSKSGFALERDSITAMTETHDMDLRVHFSCVSFERRKKQKPVEDVTTRDSSMLRENYIKERENDLMKKLKT